MPSTPKLHNDPLSLVLCQIRFSRVRKMAEYIPAIQDNLRRNGFPSDVSGILQQVLITAAGPQSIQTKQDEFRSADNTWSIIVGEDTLVLITSNYDRFAGFAAKLRMAIETIDASAELRHGQITRIGLRYLDVVQPLDGETHRDYLKANLHGPQSAVFTQGPLVHLEAAGRTELGTMILRITQNDQGILVPPDIALKPLRHKRVTKPGQLLTLIDSDHFVEGEWPFDLKAIIETVDHLHKDINAVFFRDVVTKHATTVWKAEDHAAN
jgi:uncharacterized protein (TIGR04255 family)